MVLLKEDSVVTSTAGTGKPNLWVYVDVSIVKAALNLASHGIATSQSHTLVSKKRKK